MDRVEFVSYDGAYPNLCSGTLVIKIDGQTISLGSHCLSSGGSVWFTDDWDEIVEQGPWSLSLPIVDANQQRGDLDAATLELVVALRLEIEKVINANVNPGCCGGCV